MCVYIRMFIVSTLYKHAIKNQNPRSIIFNPPSSSLIDSFWQTCRAELPSKLSLHEKQCAEKLCLLEMYWILPPLHCSAVAKATEDNTIVNFDQLKHTHESNISKLDYQKVENEAIERAIQSNSWRYLQCNVSTG